MSISVWHEHGRILDAMIEGDAAAAGGLMYRHIMDAHRRVGGAPAGGGRRD